MDSLWPWLAVAGLGALHGLNPATGWLLAAALDVRSVERGRALRAVLPIGVGHVASVGLVAAAVVLGLALDRIAIEALAGGLLLIATATCLRRRAAARLRAPAGRIALATWSFMVSSAHGAGLMLVPALLPLCRAGTATRQVTVAGSLMPALAAVALHATAMLVVTGVVATLASRGVATLRQVHRNSWRPMARFAVQLRSPE